MRLQAAASRTGRHNGCRCGYLRKPLLPFILRLCLSSQSGAPRIVA